MVHFPIANIVKCMWISAMMLELADADNPKLNKLNIMQANLLRACAKDLAAQDKNEAVKENLDQTGRHND